VELPQQAQPAEVEHREATLPGSDQESASFVTRVRATMPDMPGSVLMLLSAAAFGAMGVFGKLAYDEGATPGTLLPARFVIAAAVSWALLAAGRAGLAELRRMGRRDVWLALGLGGLGYAGQAGGFFLALERMDAGLLSLLVYTYPAIVAVAAVGLGRERLDARRVLALCCALGGLVLVVAGAGTGQLDPLGTALGIATALIYSAYILTSEGIAGRVAPRLLSALVCTGAAVTLTAGAAVTGELHPGAVHAEGWLWLSGIGVISTVAAVALFFAGMRRVGPTRAGILSTAEPLTTVLLAMAVFGEALTPVQALGGLFVVAAVLVLQVRLARRPVPATAAAT
jgi:drug/metabolite transporter (DMT)-like permease